MFINKVTVKIRKGKKYLEHIKIIRQYDDSLSMAQIKNAMERGEKVFGFDPSDNPIIHDGTDNSSFFREELFLKTLRLLKKNGADMTVMDGERECVAFAKVSSSKENVDKLIEKLFLAEDGSVAFEVIDKLKKAAKKNESSRIAIIEGLMRYSGRTQFSHMKSLVIPTINGLVKENEYQYENYYKEKIENGDSAAAYYSIEGFVKIMQKSAYGFLVDILLARKLDIECEALIVCKISYISNQPFDEGSPYEKREWTDKNLRLSEIKKWKDDGYPDGEGCKEPAVHKCLRKPSTPEEKLYAALDKKLIKRREKYEDKAHPAFWLIQADPDDIDMIKEKLDPPLNYLDFLMKASPLNVEMNLKEYGPVLLYGAQDLIDAQRGYSFIPDGYKNDDEWPENYIVIATCDADPFCIDASNADSPVYYSVHGMGEWDFEVAYDSLCEFLKALK